MEEKKVVYQETFTSQEYDTREQAIKKAKAVEAFYQSCKEWEIGTPEIIMNASGKYQVKISLTKYEISKSGYSK